MTESQVIARTLLHLIQKQNFTVESISIRTEVETEVIKQNLRDNNVSELTINKINVYRNRADIQGHFKHGQKNKSRILTVEAKGGEVFYNFYTMLGQFITMKKSPSSYYWFAFALPITWKEKMKEYMMQNGKIKPIIGDIIKKYTRNGQGLYVYFVSDTNVKKYTWGQLLK